MNQLQNLLHDSLIATDNVHHCAIIRRKDCNVRASSVGFNLDQVKMMLDASESPSQAWENGIYFDDQQYTCDRADNNSIYGKCDKGGLILVKTQSMLIVATYTEFMLPSVCEEAVEKLADYFKEKGK
nr:profilin-4-like isoform X2 [Crassostrea gigas]